MIGKSTNKFLLAFALLFFIGIVAAQNLKIESVKVNPNSIPEGTNATDITVVVRNLAAEQLNGCTVSVYFFDLENKPAAGTIAKSTDFTAGKLKEIVFSQDDSPEPQLKNLKQGLYTAMATVQCGVIPEDSAQKNFSVFFSRQSPIPETGFAGVLIVLLGILFAVSFAKIKKIVIRK